MKVCGVVHCSSGGVDSPGRPNQRRRCVSAVACIQGVYSLAVPGEQFRQFRFTVGAPDAEAKFYRHQSLACQTDYNAQQYPSLFVSKTGGITYLYV